MRVLKWDRIGCSGGNEEVCGVRWSWAAEAGGTAYRPLLCIHLACRCAQSQSSKWWERRRGRIERTHAVGEVRWPGWLAATGHELQHAVDAQYSEHIFREPPRQDVDQPASAELVAIDASHDVTLLPPAAFLSGTPGDDLRKKTG